MPAIQVIVREIQDNGRQRVLHQVLQEREAGVSLERHIRQMLVGAQMRFVDPDPAGQRRD